MGEKLREQLRQLPSSVVKTVRGKGLLNALVIDSKYDAWEVSSRIFKVFSVCMLALSFENMT